MSFTPLHARGKHLYFTVFFLFYYLTDEYNIWEIAYY